MIWSALLGFGMIAALVISWPVKRASYWVALIAVAYFLPTMFWFTTGHWSLFIMNIIVDSMICLAIDRYAKDQWEVKIFNIFRISAATSCFFFGVHIIATYFSAPSTFMGYYFEAYGILLEAINWTALALITREGWPEFYGRLSSFLSWRPDRQAVKQVIRAPRSTSSWQHR